MTPARTPQAAKRQRRAARHIAYEVRELGRILSRYEQLPKRDANLQNALLEAYLVHARCLIEFLNGRLRSGARRWDARDIRPTDFTAGWLPSGRTNRLDGYLRRIDGHLAHLTWERVDRPHRKTWNMLALTREILRHLTRFVDLLDAENSPAGPRLHAALSDARHCVDRVSRSGGAQAVIEVHTSTVGQVVTVRSN